ncbi:NCS2 family permease [Erwinia amylovora]|uniref:AzgA family transporter n=4 Tax=Erwinia amylovora TaxID=552 RepID=A0A831EUF9_ERWAM|nr:NCS2 family permease [Erwinia amylovora]CBX82589.1 putative AzgA family transporter [Erwinia amylovora ATCC BAA-2158]CCP04972.1 Putative AzgA family transporter [Erwinia amylovora Ea644]CCP09055.1 Putative AzgA family transporter [Erwinia amylovora MR1]CDK16969.1 putative AzgA family transporter [Erwinia amylovora LA635]CDK20337.1 putative AzgA family transporter [Erwinia amylovora LA636]CDK23708.1 putative AzgA family transporter [Erwinia amylovora LA637]
MTNPGLLQRIFKLQEHGTTVRTEVIAGITTFLTMVYIVFVNPQILGVAGMDTRAVFVTTCLIAAFGSILMGLVANLPVALAPAMGLNAFFAFVVVGAMGISWQVGMGAIFWGAVGLLLLTLFRVRYWMIANIPLSLRVGITAGIGLFIALMGLKNAGIIVPSEATLVTIGNLTSHSVLLGALGFFIIAIMASRHIHAAVLVSIVVTTAIGLALGDVKFSGIFSTPPAVTSVLGQVNLKDSLNVGMAGIIFSFMLVNLFDSSGTLIGVTDKAGLSNEKGTFPRMKQALYVDSISSVTGSLIGTSSVTAYIESSSGVSIGGRTGLMAVVTGLLFLLVMFLSPLAAMVPAYAVAGALIYVGVLMTSSLARVKWDDLTEAVPAFVTAVMMPFSFSITEGIALGFISYCVMKLGTARWREISPCVVVVALLFVLKIVFIDAH